MTPLDLLTSPFDRMDVFATRRRMVVTGYRNKLASTPRRPSSTTSNRTLRAPVSDSATILSG